jgi:hypothetical protein
MYIVSVNKNDWFFFVMLHPVWLLKSHKVCYVTIFEELVINQYKNIEI